MSVPFHRILYNPVGALEAELRSGVRKRDQVEIKRNDFGCCVRTNMEVLAKCMSFRQVTWWGSIWHRYLIPGWALITHGPGRWQDLEG